MGYIGTAPAFLEGSGKRPRSECYMYRLLDTLDPYELYIVPGQDRHEEVERWSVGSPQRTCWIATCHRCSVACSRDGPPPPAARGHLRWTSTPGATSCTFAS